jgi:hypothetical protein
MKYEFEYNIETSEPHKGNLFVHILSLILCSYFLNSFLTRFKQIFVGIEELFSSFMSK